MHNKTKTNKEPPQPMGSTNNEPVLEISQSTNMSANDATTEYKYTSFSRSRTYTSSSCYNA